MHGLPVLRICGRNVTGLEISAYICRVPGVFFFTGKRSEIIPVEPDQGNACAGKVTLPSQTSISLSFLKQ
jgi:hypothetical protein